MRKSAASVFGEMAEAMLGMRVREDEDDDDDEDKEGDDIVKHNRKCWGMGMKKTKKRGSGLSCTLGPYIGKVKAEALKPIEETEAVRDTRINERHLITKVDILQSLQSLVQTALSPPAQAFKLSSLPKLQVTLGPKLSAPLSFVWSLTSR